MTSEKKDPRTEPIEIVPTKRWEARDIAGVGTATGALLIVLVFIAWRVLS